MSYMTLTFSHYSTLQKYKHTFVRYVVVFYYIITNSNNDCYMEQPLQ